MADVSGGRIIAAGAIVQPPAKLLPPEAGRGPRAQPEPHGTGTRVVMQRLSITLPGVLVHPFMFQVPPLDELPVQREWNFTDYDTVGSGIHTRPGSSALKVVSFDSLFVDRDASFVVNRGLGFNPVAIIAELERIGESKTPFQLLVGQPDLWGVYYDVNMAATLRSLRSSEKAGERDARYFSVSFTQFRGIAQSQLASGIPSGLGVDAGGAQVQSGVQGTGRPPLAVLDTKNLPKGADTLRHVSKAYYGSHVLWGVIAKASGIPIAGSVSLRDYAASRPGPAVKVVVPPLQRTT